MHVYYTCSAILSLLFSSGAIFPRKFCWLDSGAIGILITSVQWIGFGDLEFVLSTLGGFFGFLKRGFKKALCFLITIQWSSRSCHRYTIRNGKWSHSTLYIWAVYPGTVPEDRKRSSGERRRFAPWRPQGPHRWLMDKTGIIRTLQGVFFFFLWGWLLIFWLSGYIVFYIIFFFPNLHILSDFRSLFFAYVRFLLYKQPWGPRAIKLAELPIYRYGSNSPNWKYRIPLVQLMISLYMLIVLINSVLAKPYMYSYIVFGLKYIPLTHSPSYRQTCFGANLLV